MLLKEQRRSDQLRRSIKNNLLIGTLLSLVAVPLTAGAALELIRNLPHTTKIGQGFSQVVIELYQKHEWVAWLWPFPVSPTWETLFTGANLLGAAAWVAAAVGLGKLAGAYANFNRLQQAKRKADDERLTDEFRHKQ